MHGNTINLGKRAAQDIAKDFANVPADHEVRAKMRNGGMVLYTRPRATGVRRLLQNLFADRAQKRRDAYQAIGNHLTSIWSQKICDAALQHARGSESNAGDYKRVFETLNKESWKALPENSQKESWRTLPESLQKELWKELPETLQRQLWEVSPRKLQKELWKELWRGVAPQLQKESWNEVPKEVQKELWQELPTQLQTELQKDLPKQLPTTLRDFLQADFGPSIVAALSAAAKKQQLDGDLAITIQLWGMKDMEPDHARDLAAEVMARSPLENPTYNVSGNTITNMADHFGVNLRKAKHTDNDAWLTQMFTDAPDKLDEQKVEASRKEWREKMSAKSVDELAEIFQPFLNELIRDLNRNVYSHWRSKAQSA